MPIPSAIPGDPRWCWWRHPLHRRGEWAPARAFTVRANDVEGWHDIPMCEVAPFCPPAMYLADAGGEWGPRIPWPEEKNQC